MENQAGFREALGDLLAIADASSRRISAEQIRSFFSEWDLSEEQWELVYSYLELNQIAVEGHQADADRLSYLKGEHVQEQETEGEQAAGGLDGEDSRCYAMYLEDLEHIKEIEPGELEMLLASFAAGDQRAKGRLAEIHLKRVVELAREYAGRGVLIGDLIQEGNMALLSAMETVSGGDFGV